MAEKIIALPTHPRFNNLSGMTFSRLTVESYAGSNRSNKALWLCTCECGKSTTVIGSELLSGHTKSCGCQRLVAAVETRRSHGMSTDPLYAIWHGMIARCTNPNNIGYMYYGGRGIKVCEKWRKSFEVFYSDMGDRPKGMTIDRIDGSKGYEPGNCRWATKSEQARNKRNNRYITFNGKTQTLTEWSKETGMSHGGLAARLNRGWTPEKALTTPARSRKHHAHPDSSKF